ncbi:hypothetical protein Dimus_007141 [Dionaea muscipula]
MREAVMKGAVDCRGLSLQVLRWDLEVMDVKSWLVVAVRETHACSLDFRWLHVGARSRPRRGGGRVRWWVVVDERMAATFVGCPGEGRCSPVASAGRGSRCRERMSMAATRPSPTSTQLATPMDELPAAAGRGSGRSFIGRSTVSWRSFGRRRELARLHAWWLCMAMYAWAWRFDFGRSRYRPQNP